MGFDSKNSSAAGSCTSRNFAIAPVKATDLGRPAPALREIAHCRPDRVGIVDMTHHLPLVMPIEAAMRTQRSIRRVKADPVDDSLVLRLIELAMKAPNGSNAQNWEFIVVKDRAVVAKLGRLNRRAIDLVGPVYRRFFQRRGDEKMLRLQKAVQWQADHFDEIPVVIVACLKGVVPPWPPVAASSAYGSIYPAVQNLLLAARAAELGAALITVPLWSKILARRALGLPWNVTPCAVITLGWPIGRYGPTTRRPVAELVSLDRFGNRAFL
jgi:nitroreductase